MPTQYNYTVITGRNCNFPLRIREPIREKGRGQIFNAPQCQNSRVKLVCKYGLASPASVCRPARNNLIIGGADVLEN